MHMNTNGVGGGMDHISRRSTSCHSKAAINVKACCKTVFSETISYSTVRSAHIESKSVAIVYRLAQLGILTYIIGYDIILNKVNKTIKKFRIIYIHTIKIQILNFRVIKHLIQLQALFQLKLKV